MNILLVEDEYLIAMEQRLYLELAGHEVTGPATDARSALSLAAPGHHDLALVDIHLAQQASGIEVALALTKIGIPCLFVTSHPEEAQASGIGLGCLVKPFSQPELNRSVAIAADIAGGRLPTSVPSNLVLFDRPHHPAP